jgi:predicted permease
MAMALVLLVGAGLMVRTLSRLWSIDPGFRSEGVLVFGLSLSPSMKTANPEAIRGAIRQLDAALATAPGVEAMSLSWAALPMQGDDEELFWPADRPRPATQSEMTWTMRYTVGPGYLQAMGIPLLRGRFLSDRDDERAPPVIVIDEVFARTHFPGEDAVGKRIHLDDYDDPLEIVGVVGHVKQWGLDEGDSTPVRVQMYQAFRRLPDGLMSMLVSGMDVVVRTRAHAPGLMDSLRRVVQGLGGDNVIFQPRAMDDIVSDSLATRRFSMFVLAGFAALALLLSCVGIYGVISYVVSQRTNEIGIRMALGARRGDVLGLVLRQGVQLAIAGVAIGVLAAIALTRLMGDLLYGIPATDPLTFAGVAAGLTLVALAASYLPARRAMRVDPMQALRHE